MNTNLSEETKKRLTDLSVTIREILPSLGEAIGLEQWTTDETLQIRRATKELGRLPYEAARTAASELKRIACNQVHRALRDRLALLSDLVLQSRQLIMTDDASAVLDCSGPGTVACVQTGKELRAAIESIVDRDQAERQLHEQRETASYSASKSTIAPVAAASGCKVSSAPQIVSRCLIDRMLEQGNSFDLGDGWSVARSSDHKWHVYFQAKHWYSWLAERDGSPRRNFDGDDTALKAVEIWLAAYSDRQAVEEFAKSKRP